jgi:hypothetical protein
MPKATLELPDSSTKDIFTDDPNIALQRAIDERAIGVTLGDGRWIRRTAATLLGLTWEFYFRGRSFRTTIEDQAVTPAKVWLPNSTFGGFTEITTGAFTYLGDQHGLCPYFEFGNFTYKGHTGAPTTAGHYFGMTIVAARVRQIPMRYSFTESVTYDADAAVLSPYKAMSKRNVNGSFCGVMIGQDFWVEPDPDKARPIDGVEIDSGWELEGEPLNETSGGTPHVIAIAMRKVGDRKIGAPKFGNRYNRRERAVSDCVLTGAPAHNETITVFSGNPFSKAAQSRVFTFKEVASGIQDIQLAGVKATGALTFTAIPPDGAKFVINDGTNPALTFEFDSNGAVAGGSVSIAISATSLDATILNALAAVNAAASMNVTATGKSLSVLNFQHDYAGTNGNETITVADAGGAFTASGMSGGTINTGLCALNVVEAINRNMAGGAAGSSGVFARALKPSEYLPGATTADDGVLPAFRVEQARLSELPAFTRNFVRHVPGEYLVQGSGAITVRALYGFGASDLNARRGSWASGMEFFDCFGGEVDCGATGNDLFTDGVYLSTASTANLDAASDLWSERGHTRIIAPRGETSTFTNGAVICQDAGWNHVLHGEQGLPVLTGSSCGLYTFKNGIHRSFNVIVGLGGGTAPVNDGATVRVVDGMGGDKTFESNVAGDAVGAGNIAVIGNSYGAFATNLKAAIDAQVLLHTLRCFTGAITDLGAGIFSFTVTFFTDRKYTVASSVTDPVDADNDITVQDLSNPWKPRFDRIQVYSHALQHQPTGSTFSRPFVWAENIQQGLDIHFTGHTLRGMEPAKSAQARSDITFAVGVPNVGDAFTVTPLDGGGVITCSWQDAIAGENATTCDILRTGLDGASTAAVVAARAEFHLNRHAALFSRRYGAEIAASGSPILWILDGVAGVNAALVAVTVNVGAKMTPPAAAHTGSADIAAQGEQYPVVLVDCANWTAHVAGILASGADGVPRQMIFVRNTSAIGATGQVSQNTGSGYGRGRLTWEKAVLLGANTSNVTITNAGGACDSIAL